MNLWSLVLFIHHSAGLITGTNTTLHYSMQQEEAYSANIFVKIEEKEITGNLQVTILNSQYIPLRIIPFAPNSIAAGQLVCLAGLSSGKYIVRITMADRAAEEQFVIRQ
ncbi:hypothetical protein [Chitinophaga sp. MM2321]|uniref:hypothetical protein n=1 Tax=Chitinophaga sp. MM2321 TaxID=3137178 RepID=UPI0032D56C96